VDLDEMMFEEPNEGRATAAEDRRKAESIRRKAGKRHGSSAASHKLRPVDCNALKRKTRLFQ
jgi:general stress protein YciG